MLKALILKGIVGEMLSQDKRGQTTTNMINRIGSGDLRLKRREERERRQRKLKGRERGSQAKARGSRGYRGKAEGAASIVPHNGGFVQSEGGWDQGAVSVWVQTGRPGATELFPGK